MIPRTGDVVHVNARASVQFGGDRGFYFRVIRAHTEWHTYYGWIWLSGYVLNSIGEAAQQRVIFVQTDGLRCVTPPQPPPRRAAAGGNR